MTKHSNFTDSTAQDMNLSETIISNIIENKQHQSGHKIITQQSTHMHIRTHNTQTEIKQQTTMGAFLLVTGHF